MADGPAEKNPCLERLGPMAGAKDRAEALEIIVSSFPKTKGMREHMGRALWRGPTFDPAHTRLAVTDGRVVSAVVMVPRMVRFGPATVPAMTVGPVATREEYRNRGYCTATMNEASRYMREHGFVLAYLQGPRRLYARFGYFHYMEHGLATVKTDDANNAARPGRLRTMKSADLPAVARVYEHATAGRIMSARRDRAVWQWLLGCGAHSWMFRGPKLILDGSGRLDGYLTLEPAPGLGIREFVVAPQERSWRAALGALGALASKRQADAITFPLAWDDPMCVFLRKEVGVRLSSEVRRGGGALMKIVDFLALMRALGPLFNQRWQAAGRREDVKFTLASETGAVGLYVAGRKVRVGDPCAGQRAWVPQAWLPGLVSGVWSARDLARQKGPRLPEQLTPILEVLFPACRPYSYRGDLY